MPQEQQTQGDLEQQTETPLEKEMGSVQTKRRQWHDHEDRAKFVQPIRIDPLCSLRVSAFKCEIRSQSQQLEIETHEISFPQNEFGDVNPHK